MRMIVLMMWQGGCACCARVTVLEKRARGIKAFTKLAGKQKMRNSRASKLRGRRDACACTLVARCRNPAARRAAAARQSCCIQFQGDSGRSSGSSLLSMAACSTITMGLEAVGLPLAGKVTDTTVNTEYGAKRNSSSPSTLVFSTRFTCLQRYLHSRHHAARKRAVSVAKLSPERSLAARVDLYDPVNGRLASVERHVPEPAAAAQ